MWAHPRTVPLTQIKPELYTYQELVWGYPEPFMVEALTSYKIETDNYSFEVVETPGHSKDHVTLIEAEEGLNTEQIVDKVFGGESSLAELTDHQFAAKHLISSLLKK